MANIDTKEFANTHKLTYIYCGYTPTLTINICTTAHKQQSISLIASVTCKSFTDDAHTKMQFSLSPPPYKASASSDLTSSAHDECVNDWNLANNLNNNSCQTKRLSGRNMQQVQDQQKHGDIKNGNVNSEAVNEEVSDYVQWLHAMKLVARLPGGVPSEFRRKVDSENELIS